MGGKHFRKLDGEYIGVFSDGATPPKGAMECTAPRSSKAKWANNSWEIKVDKDEVNAERDKRTDGGFVFDGNEYQSDPKSIRKITGAAALANRAIDVFSKKAGDYKWLPNATEDFFWILADNTMLKLDAHQMSALGYAAAGWVQHNAIKARNLKNLSTIPADFDDEKHW